MKPFRDQMRRWGLLAVFDGLEVKHHTVSLQENSATIKESSYLIMLKLKSLNTRDALCAAASKGCLEAVSFFVEEGVDKDGTDKEGQTPLMLATQNNHLAVVKLLKEHKTDKKKADMSLKMKSLDTRDALRAAANQGCMDAVRFLVEEDVSVIDTDNEGRTPWMLAIQSGHMAVARYLVESMQERSNHTNNSWGSAALMFAALNGHLAVVRWLLEQGADKDKGDRHGYTPLMFAAMNGHLAVVQWLTEQGADKDKADRHGYTALIHLAINGQLEALQWLLEKGADVNKEDIGGLTPLHWAAFHRRAAMVTCLMNWGASLTAKSLEHSFFANRLPIDMTNNEEIKQLICDEEIRRRDHGYKRAVIPNPTAAERKRARIERGEDEDETEGQGQAVASAVAEEDDGENDDSGSDVEY